MFKRIFGSSRKKSTEEFTLDQLKSIQGLVSKEIEEISKKKQEIIDEGTENGMVVSTETLLESLDELKTSYDGDNPEEYFATIEKMKQDFREKYGDSIPVDLAYKISEGIELPFVKEESPKENAIELAKKCVINTDPEHGDITWEDVMDNINNRILSGQLENYKFTG